MLVYYCEIFLSEDAELKIGHWYECDRRDFAQYMRWLPINIISVYVYIPDKNQKWRWTKFKGWENCKDKKKFLPII